MKPFFRFLNYNTALKANYLGVNIFIFIQQIEISKKAI